MTKDEGRGGDPREAARKLANDEPYASLVAQVEAKDESLRHGNAALVAAVLYKSGEPLSVLEIGRQIIGRQDDKVVRNFTYPALKRLTAAGVVRSLPATFTYTLTEAFRTEIDKAGTLSDGEAAKAGEGMVGEIDKARAESREADAVDFHGMELPRTSLAEAEAVRREALDMASRGDVAASDGFREALDPADWRRLVHETAFTSPLADDGAPVVAKVPDMDGDDARSGIAEGAGISGKVDGMVEEQVVDLVDVPAARTRTGTSGAGAPLKDPERQEVHAVVASVTASLQALRDRKAGESRARVHAEVVRRLDSEIRAMLAEGIPMAEIREAVSAGGFDLPEDYEPSA